MKNDELTYDWLDFLAEQKSVKKDIFKEIKASQTNPKSASIFGDYEYQMASGDSIKITNNAPPMGTAELFCTAQNKVIQTVQFHNKFIANLERAYKMGSKRYCPKSAGGFNPRKVRNKNSLKLPPEQRSLSNHSFGAAIDFDSTKNPFRKGFTSEIEKYPEFIEAFERNGFTWLGDGAGRKGPGHPGDDMHFEIRVDGEALNIAADDNPEVDTSSGSSLASYYKSFGPADQTQATQLPQQQNTTARMTAESLNKKLLKENIISVPNNLNRQPRNQRVVGIVIHHSNTNDPKTTLRVLQQRGYSTNYEVDQKGNIYQYINPDEGYALATGAGANKYTVAIDVTTGNGSWPPAQVEAVKMLVNSIAQKYGFQLKLAPDQGPYDWNTWKDKGFTLFRHRNFVATQCPSTFPMEQIAGPASEINLNVSGANNNQLASGNIISYFKSFGANTDTNSKATATTNSATKSTIEESVNDQIFKIVDKTEEKFYKKYKKYFESLLNHLKKELKITKSVKIVFEDDKENSKKVLGRTGGYLNEESKIHIFTTGRHVKDIMRSLAHEMVHHRQNIRGEFKKAEPTENGYAQKNPHLRKMEKEAFLKGNILFRDWEDNYKYRGEK